MVFGMAWAICRTISRHSAGTESDMHLRPELRSIEEMRSANLESGAYNSEFFRRDYLVSDAVFVNERA